MEKPLNERLSFLAPNDRELTADEIRAAKAVHEFWRRESVMWAMAEDLKKRAETKN